MRGSDEGDEPFLVEEEFAGKSDWRTLDASFLDRAPSGLGSALSFFSDEAFRFYLPAYLIADVDGRLASVDPVFYLCHGLDNKSRAQKVNPKRFGSRTWLDTAHHRFSVFKQKEVRAIVAYLVFRRERDPLDKAIIDQSLNNYWASRAETE